MKFALQFALSDTDASFDETIKVNNQNESGGSKTAVIVLAVLLALVILSVLIAVLIIKRKWVLMKF